MALIYKITNSLNDRVYIGKTLETLERRWKGHIKDSKKISSSHRPLYSAIRKYGIENFQIELIEECDHLIVDEREKYWIGFYNSFRNGYNATLGGDGHLKINYELVISCYEKTKNCADVARKLNIHRDSVLKILKEYNIPIENANSQRSKKILLFDIDNNFLDSFDSIHDGGRFLKDKLELSTDLNGICSHIRKNCNKTADTAYGYKWEWELEY